jgi:hypothetical protein
MTAHSSKAASPFEILSADGVIEEVATTPPFEMCFSQCHEGHEVHEV